MRPVVRGGRWPGIMVCLGLLLPLAALAGCSPGRVTVSGQVRYQGAPLPGGRLNFRPEDPKQNAASAELDAQGNYEVVLPAGRIKVSVDNRYLKPPPPLRTGLPPGLPADVKKKLGGKSPPPKAGGDAPEKPPGKYVKIPEKYYDIESSGLDFAAEGGTQQHDIELKK